MQITTAQRGETTEVSVDGTWVGNIEPVDDVFEATYGLGVENILDSELSSLEPTVEDGCKTLYDLYVNTKACEGCSEPHAGSYAMGKCRNCYLAG
jgi:hypothetical protein